MTDQDEYQDLYGAAARHSEHRVGMQITFHAGDRMKTGTILYVVEATSNQAVAYIIMPTKEKFPIEVQAHDVIER